MGRGRRILPGLFAATIDTAANMVASQVVVTRELVLINQILAEVNMRIRIVVFLLRE